MHRTIKALAFGLLALSAQHVMAHTNKTFLSTRPQGIDSLLERVTLQSMTASQAEDAFGGIFQASAFYNEAVETSGLSKYFLFQNKDSASLTREGLQKFIPDHNTEAEADAVIRAGGAPTPLSKAEDTNIKLSPTLRSYGIYLTYYQDLEKILPGLYFNVRVPIVEVETDLGLIATGGNSETVKQFLSGSLAEIPATASYARKPLQYAKINGRQQAIGIADIDLRMGYAFLQREKGNLGLSIGLTVPTGNHPEAKQAFEAIYGNNGHWGLGTGLDGRYKFWEGEDSDLSFHANVDYGYFFVNTERRTVGIKGLDWGQYHIVATKAQSGNLQAIPAANALTLSTDITPGMQLDNAAGFTFTYGGLTLDVAYNLWYRDQESVKLRDAWDDTRYVHATNALAATRFGTTPVAPGAGAGNDVNLATAGATHTDLTLATLDLDAARTPAQLSNKILGSVGYIFKEFEYPIMLGIGGHYEIPNDNSTARTWGFFCKTGIAF
ncbi:hypothetical protein FJ364_02250 [Candidatus Dependentiae bacterium]|nr:hypothetical protein [Candidatus Dependentiae bacterium]